MAEVHFSNSSMLFFVIPKDPFNFNGISFKTGQQILICKFHYLTGMTNLDVRKRPGKERFMF